MDNLKHSRELTLSIPRQYTRLVLSHRASSKLFAIFAFTLMGLSLIFMGQSHAQQAAMVVVDPVVQEPLSQTTPVLGRLVAQQKADVASLIQGPIKFVSVQIGDRVEMGAALVTIDDARLRQSKNLQAALLQQSRASLKAVKNEQAFAEQELERMKKLKSSAAFSLAKLEDKQLELVGLSSKVAVAEAAVAAARVNLSLAEIDLKRAVIRAPFNGVVTEKFTESGAYVSKGKSVLSLINYQNMEVEVDVPSNRLSGLHEGRMVHIQLAGKDKYEAIVRAVIPEENVLTRTRAVRLIPALKNNVLKKLANGQSATVYVPVGSVRNIITVHKDALTAKGDGYTVYIVEKNKAVMRSVKVGDATGTRFEILSGLKAGDLAVIRGNERLRPGQDIKIAP